MNSIEPQKTDKNIPTDAENSKQSTAQSGVAIDCKIDELYYGNFLAVRDSEVPIEKNKITGFIGPSGCG